jgi:broad specificity phosphatase PhoE
MLILVRHGRTAANAMGLLQGRLDLSLDDEGRRQAQAIAALLSPVDRIVSSPLMRAQETAAAFGQPVEIDDRWIELDYGELDGCPIGEVPPEMWREWRSDLSFCPPGGESLLQLGGRVTAACADLAASASRADVVVVSHVSPIKAAVAWALGVDQSVSWRMHLDQASVTRIDIGSTSASLRVFNDTGHITS